jgi:flagellar motor component MotA
VAVATNTAARHATSHDASTYHVASAMMGDAAPGIGALVAIVVIILVMTGLARAARSLAALVSELLRVATAVTSVLLTTVIAIFLGIAFLVH